jgi:hypothetical protein
MTCASLYSSSSAELNREKEARSSIVIPDEESVAQYFLFLFLESIIVHLGVQNPM